MKTSSNTSTSTYVLKSASGTNKDQNHDSCIFYVVLRKLYNTCSGANTNLAWQNGDQISFYLCDKRCIAVHHTKLHLSYLFCRAITNCVFNEVLIQIDSDKCSC